MLQATTPRVFVSRRHFVLGGLATTAMASAASPAGAVLPAWFGAVTAAFVSGLLVEAVKNYWGLSDSDRPASPGVNAQHQEEASSLQRQGLGVQVLYNGPYYDQRF